MAMIRIFVAIRVPVLPLLERWVEGMKKKPYAADVKWTNPAYWHVTLRFIGGVETSFLPTLSQEMARNIREHRPGFVSLSGAGYFGRQDHPRVLWAGVNGGDWLKALQASVQSAITQSGRAQQAQVFTPHLTIGRIKHASSSPEMVAETEKQASCEWGQLQVNEVVLFRSDLTTLGPVYTVLETYHLND
jgi:2'-5' RNA ligase